MKQYITQKQWEELDLNQVEKWFSEPREKSDTYLSNKDMIYFLGDDWWKFLEEGKIKISLKGELCDALWEAVKYKLTK